MKSTLSHIIIQNIKVQSKSPIFAWITQVLVRPVRPKSRKLILIRILLDIAHAYVGMAPPVYLLGYPRNILEVEMQRRVYEVSSRFSFSSSIGQAIRRQRSHMKDRTWP